VGVGGVRLNAGTKDAGQRVWRGRFRQSFPEQLPLILVQCSDPFKQQRVTVLGDRSDLARELELSSESV
jgi:hypothetical protein